MSTGGKGTGDRRRSHSAHKRFFKTKHFLVFDTSDGTVLSLGDHRYEFQLQIPPGNIPPSFRGFYGKIVHVLQAKMSQSWHPSAKETMELHFVSRSFPFVDQIPQAGSVDKSLGVFSKGQVHMRATVNKTLCSPGETLTVTAQITNKSSKKMRVKFSVDQKTVYRAHAHAKIQNATVCKVVGETIAPDYTGNVSCSITIPPDTNYSLQNCEIITVEYYLKVYLDISFAPDPEIMLPLIIVPQPGDSRGPYPSRAFGGPGYSDFPLPAPGPVPVGPPNAYPPPAPNLFTNVPSGYNQIPQQPAPYSFPAAPFMFYPVPPRAATMNPQFPQEEAPLSYVSVFPPAQSGTESDRKTEL